MQRSSETIGAIAGALAKAQIELQNPEKSLTAIIRSGATACNQAVRAVDTGTACVQAVAPVVQKVFHHFEARRTIFTHSDGE